MLQLSEVTAVSLEADNYERHISHVYAGFVEYSKRWKVPLRYVVRKKSRALRSSMHGLWAYLQFANGEEIAIYFDMADWADIASTSALDVCDIYVKRSFSQLIVDQFPACYRNKIVPYGFYFACSGRSRLEDLRMVQAAVVRGVMKRQCTLVTGCTEVAKFILRLSGRFDPPFLQLSDLEQIKGGNNTVFYHANLWDPKVHKSYYSKSIDEINETRINLVRELRAALGPNFVGGIVPSKFAYSMCSELITPHATDKKSYLRLLADSKIAVADTGLHGSAGSKLGEYFAAGRCILSEELNYEIPSHPVNQHDWFVYSSPAECAKLCKKLVADPELVEQTSRRARDFYNHTAAPLQCIEALTSKVSFESKEVAVEYSGST